MTKHPNLDFLMKGKRKTKTYVVLHDESDDETLAIPHARSFHITGDGLRVQPTPASPQKGTSARDSPPPRYDWNPSALYEEGADVLDQPFQDEEEEVAAVSDVAGKIAAKRYPTSVHTFSHSKLRRLTLDLQDAPLLDWAGRGKEDPGFRDEYLAEMVRLEGRGDGRLRGCMSCSSADGFYRCEDCLGGMLECRTCCLQRHRHLPLHIIQVRVARFLDDPPLNRRSNGTRDSFKKQHSRKWGYGCNLGTWGPLAWFRGQATRTL
jgi:hypothetical protein